MRTPGNAQGKFFRGAGGLRCGGSSGNDATDRLLVGRPRTGLTEETSFLVRHLVAWGKSE